MLLNSALDTPAWTWPPSPAAACLKAGNKTQLRAFSLLEKGSGKGDPCFSLQVSLKLEWTTYSFCQNNLERIKLRKKKFTAEAHGSSRCLVTPSLPDCTLA